MVGAGRERFLEGETREAREELGRGRQQADRGPDPDPDADLYGPGPMINTLIGDFNVDGAILLTAADRGRKRRVSDTGRETQKNRRESGREESE